MPRRDWPREPWDGEHDYAPDADWPLCYYCGVRCGSEESEKPCPGQAQKQDENRSSDADNP